MRTALLVALALLGEFAAEGAAAQASFVDSPHREPIPPHGPCDVIVTPSNYLTTLAQYSPSPHVNDPTERVFCVEPGDYRARGEVLLLASGTQQNRRFLRFRAEDGVANAAQRAQRAIFESINVVGDWWVIQGLTVEPVDPGTATLLLVYGGDHNLIDGNLVDGGRLWNNRGSAGIALKALSGDPTTYNTVQRNLVRNGNRSRLDVDFFGVLVGRGSVVGENNDGNRVVDNEIADWGDGVAVGSNTTDCQDVAVQHGTVIDGNDIYLTSAMRIDCDSGALDPDGGCACAENGIDVKGDPGAQAANWTRVTRNRVWGYRPTSLTAACGGSGSNGQAITAGNTCTGHVLVAQNVVMDSTTGIAPAGSNWIIAGNLLHEIREVPGFNINSLAIHASPGDIGLDVQFNTMVAVDTAYDDASDDTDTRCNVVIEDENLFGNGQPRGTSHSTRFNYLYDALPYNFVGSTNRQYASASQSNSGDYCFWRRRWSGPEQVCIPYASTTSSSPHVAAVSSCSPTLGAPFGLEPIGWTSSVPCDDGIDNDGDGATDVADPGCQTGAAPREDPRCQNGLDDDGDGKIDFDGGTSANGGVALASADAQCVSAHQDTESRAACGIGFELAGVLLWLRRQRKRPRHNSPRALGFLGARDGI